MYLNKWSNYHAILQILLALRKGCFCIIEEASWPSFLEISRTTSSLDVMFFKGCVRESDTCVMYVSHASFRYLSTSCICRETCQHITFLYTFKFRDLSIIFYLFFSRCMTKVYSIYYLTFFESSWVSINSGNPSNRNSRNALLVPRENILERFLKRLYAAAAICIL